MSSNYSIHLIKLWIQNMSKMSLCQVDLHNFMQYAKYSLSTTSIIFNSVTFTQYSVEGVWERLCQNSRPKFSSETCPKDHEFTTNTFSCTHWTVVAACSSGTKIFNSNVLRYYAHKYELSCLRRDGLSGVQKYHILCNRFEPVLLCIIRLKPKVNSRFMKFPAVDMHT